MKVGTPLQRGKACLNCRKRKMVCGLLLAGTSGAEDMFIFKKCDGIRPACTQCIKANRDEECQYHDKKQVSRTEMLRAKVAKLEARLRELENEQSGSASSSPAPQSPGPSSSSSQGEILLMPPGTPALVLNSKELVLTLPATLTKISPDRPRQHQLLKQAIFCD